MSKCHNELLLDSMGVGRTVASPRISFVKSIYGYMSLFLKEVPSSPLRPYVIIIFIYYLFVCFIELNLDLVTFFK